MRQANNIFSSLDNKYFKQLVAIDLGKTFLAMNQLDSAVKYGQLAFGDMIEFNGEKGYTLNTLGLIYTKAGDTEQALDYFKQSLNATIRVSNYRLISDSYYGLAKLYQQINNEDSCIYFAQKSLAAAQKGTFYSNMMDASRLLASIYENKDWQKAFQYNNITIEAKDILYTIGKRYAFNNIAEFDEKKRQYEIETAQNKK
jgi:tetratricopeptide (TPR) repeat protein